MENEIKRNLAARYWFEHSRSKPLEMHVNAQGLNEVVW